jgi:putative ABC transport system substrate-binding protein
MRRREFISLLCGSAVGWPLATRAQQSKAARIGVLYIGLADGESLQKELREGLRELGYVEGQSIAFEFRSAQGELDRLSELAAELVRLRVDLIVALYVQPSLAAKHATHEIPIVVIAADPVETGIVPSLAHPGGNITGVSLMSAASNAKNVELFRDMIPSLRRVGVLGNASDPVFAKAMLDEVRRSSGPTGTEIQPIVMVRGLDEFESAFTTMVSDRADAVIVQGTLAIKYRLPTASTTRAFADIGGLMSFGADGPASFRYAAKFVQRIVQGKHPKDIPIEQPNKFELLSTSRLRRL